MAADHFCLRWNNYQSNMVSELDSLRSDEDLVDVTLSCEGQLLKAHKVILSACSSYFRSVFKDNPCKHPVVILKDVSYEDVEALLSFVYQGVVYISEKKLASFLQTAELLQIRGLTGAATTLKEASYSDTTTGQNKMTDRNSVPPPPQLLTANLINSWKQQGMLNTAPPSLKSPMSNPPSPSMPVAKRRKCVSNKVASKENFECSDTNSNQDCSENDSDASVVKKELQDPDARIEDDCNSIDDILREESSREGNPSFYDNVESDETEEETGEVKNKERNSNASSSNLFGMVANYTASQSSVDPNFSASGDTRLGRRPCPLCQKIISNKSNLLKHMRIRHSDEHNPAGCTICNKVFKNKYSLRAHINIYHKEMVMAAAPVAGGGSTSQQHNVNEYQTLSNQVDVDGNSPDYSGGHHHHHHHQHHGRHRSSTPLYTPSTGNFVVSSSVGSDLSTYRHLVKENNVINQFNISNLPLT